MRPRPFHRQTGAIETFVRDLLDDVGALGSPWLQLVAFGLAFGETAFLLDFVIPGEVGLVVVAAAALGATLGDSVGWLLGRYGLRSGATRPDGSRGVRSRRLNHGNRI